MTDKIDRYSGEMKGRERLWPMRFPHLPLIGGQAVTLIWDRSI